MRITKTTAASVLAAIALLGAGCGSDDDDGSSAGGSADTALAKAELAKQANAICRKFNARIKALPAPKTEKGLPAYFDKALPITQEAGRELKALEPADDVKATWDGLLKDYDTLVATTAKATAALKAKKQKEYDEIRGQIALLNGKSNQKLDAFGAVDCGSKADA
ncbi:hypothetical protein DSM112329_03938 [Paraconexibacter sp. AEG42_29]|uniref:Imelysin-like domain-containing protein n=1 Tax=Paraconexibacter sp. AEG42_29 TaxID=2997339 RepID=A0AAU7AZG5_9ACTN